ncbi:hypothetical protein BgiMline_033553, partial [Biomphalaria glabrata]
MGQDIMAHFAQGIVRETFDPRFRHWIAHTWEILRADAHRGFPFYEAVSPPCYYI